ncbi:Jacalin-like lectin domain-containing protein [Peziza echinospora]|nr:Jacalin-like lectin domain-containing protein [Peziza echinospora]
MANAIPGGNGGHPFSDNPGQVASIHIWWEGAYSRSGLRGIECKYIDGRASRRHGDNGATEFVFTLACEEYLTTIEIWADNGLVHALRFATNQRISHAIGNTHYSGAFHKLSTFHAPKGAVLCGFEGRSGARVDALAPLWDIPSVSGATGMQHRIEITSNDIRQTPRITNRGNIYGNGASGLARVGCGLDKATISRITVMESNGKLMAVTLDYTNSGTVGSGLDLVVDHNDNPETHSLEGVFHLQSNEYIVCIKGQGDGNNIHQLVFVTNTGRFSSRFGSCNRGSQTFELKALGNQPGMALSYLDYSVNAYKTALKSSKHTLSKPQPSTTNSPTYYTISTPHPQRTGTTEKGR